MKILDAKLVSEYLLKHKKHIESASESIEKHALLSALLDQLAIISKTVQNLDGSALAALKDDLKKLYFLIIQWQVAEGEAQNSLLSTTFVVRLYEQESLLIREMRESLGETLNLLKTAVTKKDLLRAFTYVGGITGAVMTVDELMG
jgi:hypothetical protein